MILIILTNICQATYNFLHRAGIEAKVFAFFHAVPAQRIEVCSAHQDGRALAFPPPGAALRDATAPGRAGPFASAKLP